MAWGLTVFSFAALVAAGVFAALAVVGRRRRQSGARAFTALMTVGVVWAATYGVQLGFPTRAGQLPLQRVVLAASSLVPALLFLFAFSYADRPARLTRRAGAVALCEAGVFALLCLTNGFHHLVWSAASLVGPPGSPVLELTFAVGYYAHIAFAYSMVALSTWAILSVYFGSTDVYRRQSALLLAGISPAFLSHILYTLKAGPIPGLDFTPLALSFSGLTFGLALFHFDLLNRTPVAHRRAVELTGDGLLVVDSAGVVVDCNRVARRVYDVDVGTDAATGLGVADDSLLELTGTTTCGVVDGVSRTYDVYVSELTTDSGRFAGFTVVLRDVTDRVTYERRLEVVNRVLRHNLRNDMNVVLGNADLLAERAASAEQHRSAAVIRSKASRLVELGEKARQITNLRAVDRGERSTVALGPLLDALSARFRDAYPEATVSVDCPDGARATAPSEQTLSAALWNLLDNAGAHNDASSLTVEVTVTSDDAATRIRVRDDGSGLPPVERAVLQARAETPLEHSSGLGLWLTYWITETAGGEVGVETPASGGTEITLAFPTGSASDEPAEAAPDVRSASAPATDA